jgi:hypothetical protein
VCGWWLDLGQHGAVVQWSRMGIISAICLAHTSSNWRIRALLGANRTDTSCESNEGAKK